MKLQRENILTLIGSGRYHSCILTTFSFDFYFFEMKAMKWLRSCGVRNINVFIDGHYYSELMQQTTGVEMQLTPGYSLYPIFQKSIFHPKIWMLFGNKEGLLIIGSGNLTNSGNGNNDEIWGAFHFDIHQTENAFMFSTAWDYVSNLCSSVRGIMNEKTTQWIIEHSKWLNELPKAKQFQFADTSQKEKIAFLYNFDTSTIWEQLSKLTRNENVIEITTVSPFYDTNGKALLELKSLFPKAEINVVIDENGLIPSTMQVSKAFAFYDWFELGISKPLHSKTENKNNKTKLHAKIIHFKTKSKKEFCLFGSANVTNEGLGLATKHFNTEVSLLLQSQEGGILNQLGIKLKANKSKKLSDFTLSKAPSIYETVIKNNQFKIKLLSAELNYEELTLFADGNYSTPFRVAFFDRQNRFIHSQNISEFKQELEIKLNATLQNFQYVQFFESVSDEIISNKILVSDILLLAKTHPNPKTEDIERIYSEIQNGDLSRVLDLLHYAIFDETEKEEGASFLLNSKNIESKKEEKKSPEKLYDLSSYKSIENISLEKHLLLSSLSLRVLDVLRFIHSKVLSPIIQEDISIDEQEEDLGNISGNDESEVKKVRAISHSLLKSERKKLINYFDNLYNYQQELLYGNKRTTPYKPTLTDLTKYLIALELIMEYGGKSEKYDEQDKQLFFCYLPFSIEYGNDNVKGCCLNLIGDFLMLARTGFKEYEFPYTKKKVEQLKSEAIVCTIVCLLNNRWKEDELHYRNTMLLNTLHYLGWKDIEEFESNFSNLIKAIDQKISELKHRTNGIEENLKRFIRIVCPAFKSVITRRANLDFDKTAIKGQLIYSSLVGYCYIQSVTKTNDFTLIRPGFMWDDKQEDYLKHRPDEVYSPLKLSSFICIDL